MIMKLDILLTLIVIISIPTFTYYSFNSNTQTLSKFSDASEGNISGVTLEAKPELTNRSVKTINGLELMIFEMKNEKNETVTKSITIGNRVYNITLEPKTAWNYAKISDVVIVPMSNAVINENLTTFYPLGNILRVAFSDTNGLSEVRIYRENKISSFLITGTDANILYDEHNVILNSKNFSKEFLIYFFDSYPNSKDLFIEDTRKIEEKEYLIEKLYNQLEMANKTLNLTKSRVDELINKIKIMESEIEQRRNETEIFLKEIPSLNKTKTQLESLISGSVVVSPVAVGFEIVILVVLIYMLLKKIYFKGESEKK